MKHTCSNCTFYADSLGACRRYPPDAHIRFYDPDGDGEEHMQLATLFPSVQADWWCGEWRNGYQDFESPEEPE